MILETCLLYKLSIPRSRGKVPPYGEADLCIGNAARKLKPYFQAHTIVVLTNRPLRRAMSSPEATGRMALWVVELSEFDI